MHVDKGRDIRYHLLCRHRRQNIVLLDGLDVADEHHRYAMPAAQSDHLGQIVAQVLRHPREVSRGKGLLQLRCWPYNILMDY